MNWLTYFKRFTLTLILAFIGVISWGQSLSLQDPSSPNSETNPYLISSTDNWNIFANNSEYWDAGVYVKLSDNWNNLESPVTTMVGYTADDTPFSGTFDGNGKTLNVSYSDEYYYLAPFYWTDGATIHDLTVAGTIDVLEYEYAGYSAGLIYSNTTYNSGRTTVNNVTVNVNINASNASYCAGFAVYSLGLDFSNCVYNGQIIAGVNSGGFSASYDSSGENATFNNCIFAPASGSSIASGATFATNSTSWTGCYYTDNLGTTAQGKIAYNTTDDIPSGEIAETVTVHGTTVYGKVDVEVTGVNNVYDFTGQTIEITPAVTFDDNPVDSGSQYNYSFTPSPVQAVGDYTLTINGVHDETYHYYGSYTKIFSVTSGLSGEGTEEHPFEISSTTDWNYFANKVNTGVAGYASAYYKLTNDITVSTMVGTPTRPFKGNFSGTKGLYEAYTLTFNYGTSESPTTETIVAPFRYTEDAAFSSLIVDGAIYTNVGKEAGLIGVNTHASENNTTIQFVINNMDFYCFEDLLDAEGGGYAYDGSDISFLYCSYEGKISANNYHGGFCGKADEHTTFTRCLFDPEPEGFYWAENFVYDEQGAIINYNGTDETNGCFYTVGPNQEESNQGTKVFVNTVPEGNIGHKLTTFHEKVVYKPVTVVISGVNKRYKYTGSPITVAPTAVTFDGIDALDNNYCEYSIDPSPVQEEGKYTFTLTAPTTGATGEAAKYLGTINQIVRVVNPSSSDWTDLQAQLSGTEAIINLTKDIVAGEDDACLIVENGRTVTINLNGYKIDRHFYDHDYVWSDSVVGGQVLKIASGATVTIYGNNAANPSEKSGTITGGSNKAPTVNEHAENSDGGGIFNMGSLTLENVTIEGNSCRKKQEGVSRTARGGGIYSGKNSTLIINNCTIRNNEAKGGGGGLFVEKAAVFEMKDTQIRSNITQDKGGGVRLNAEGTKHNDDAKALVNGALIKDCNIENNTVVLHNINSASNGGGLHMDAGTLYLTDSKVKNNMCSKFGGGIYQMGGTINASGCDILYNQSYDASYRFDGLGGGVCVLGGTFKMIGGTVSSNSSYREDGGGIYVLAGKTLKLEGSITITENWTIEDGNSGTHTTNVYLAGENDKITISGSIEGSTIGVSKYKDTGVFTSGLNGKGTIACFSSDNSAYSIVSYYNEAKLTTISHVDPPVSGVWEIDEPVTLQETVPSDGHAVTGIVILENGFLYVNEGGLINGIPITNNTDNAATKLVINGGQVITSTSGVPATVKKDIKEALVSSQADWYLISSPLVTLTGNNPINIIGNTNLVILSANNFPEYDLYRFNEGATLTNANGNELQWENYRAVDGDDNPLHADFTTLEKGRGYLYRNYNDYTITLTGAINVDDEIDYALSYHAEVNDHNNIFKGFNIIGNPYTHNISKGITGAAIPNTYLEAKYYVLDETDGSWDLTNDGTAIPPVTGILVQATEASTLTITNSTTVGGSKGVANNNIWFTVANNRYDDRACVEFRNGHGLNKIAHPNEDVPMLYINYNGEDFASVDMNPETKAFNLNFEAKTTGYYTLSVKPQGDYSYLHLIDKVAGEDIDLLKDNEYSFIGMAGDNADRFIVRMESSESPENSIFAYQTGNEIVVSGEGELQVFDVTGRKVMQRYVSGVETWHAASVQTGVYILKMGDKIQKIVIR